MPLLLILFIGVPLAEIATFIQVGGWIGLWPTLATVVITALIGSALLRHQGLAALARARAEMARDQFPAGALLDGACLVFAGALLLTPGFLTDAVGFALFIPGVRQAIGGFLLRHIRARTTVHGGYGPSDRGPSVVDGEFEDVTGNDTPNHPGPTLPPSFPSS